MGEEGVEVRGAGPVGQQYTELGGWLLYALRGDRGNNANNIYVRGKIGQSDGQAT